MLCTELAILAAAREKGFDADVYAGLSLGEYAALAACGALTTEAALALIVKRGALMQDAVPYGGAMTAVMGLENEVIEAVCQKTAGIVSVANYNCPGQTVITGEKAAVEAAAEALKVAGAKRCIPLNVSGPFHSSMLQEAGKKLEQELATVEIHDFNHPYVTNVTAEYVTDKNQIKQLLTEQISSPVCWQQSIERMIRDGVDTFIEIGPKKTLTGFLKKINKDVRAIHIETVEDLESLVSR